MISWYRSSMVTSVGLSSSAGEEGLRRFDALREWGQVVVVVVDVHTGPCSGIQAETSHQRFGAVVPDPHAHALRAEHRADIVRVDTLDGERDRSAAQVGIGGTVDTHALDRQQRLEHAGGQLAFVLAY